MRFRVMQSGWFFAIAALACGGNFTPNSEGGGGSGGTSTVTGRDDRQTTTSVPTDVAAVTTGFTTGVTTTGFETTGVTIGVTTGITTGFTTGTCGSAGGAGGAGGFGGATPGPSDAGVFHEAAPPDVASIPTRTNGFVIRYGDFPVIGSGTSGTAVTTTGGPVKDPNTEYLMVGVGKASCQQPHQAGCDAWYVSIEIPPALFHPGVIELGCGSASGYFSYTGVGQPGGYCSGGHGGPFYQGTVEILNISATNVVFRLSNTPAFGVPADGMYNLPRCP